MIPVWLGCGRTDRRLGLPIVAGLLCLPLVGLTTTAQAAGPLTKPSYKDAVVCKLVSELVQRQHFSQHPVDDEISNRGLTQFLKTLDPLKLYFVESDIEGFLTHKNELDDMIKKGNLSLAYDIYKVYLERINERVALADKLLGEQQDFTLDEEMIVDRDSLRWPKTEEQVTERWRQRIKYDLLLQKAEKVEGDAAVEKLRKRYKNFAHRMEQTDSDELLEMFLTSITSTLDPHTTYMSPSQLDNFRILMSLNLDGIGAKLEQEDGVIRISEIIAGGAADKHGKLKATDQVVSVGQDADGEMLDVREQKLNDVVEQIRGKAGTVVRLGVLPGGTGDFVIYNIERAKIQLEDSAARSVIFESGMKADGKPYRVGVIELPSFYMDMEASRTGQAEYRSTTRDMRKLLDEFRTQNVDGVIVDLRRNGGGSLPESINSTGLFIDEGPIVQVKDSDGRSEHYDDMDRGMAWEGPLVVLISKFSASASEIFAGAIQDYHRGLIVGDESTHGKGTVQSLLDLSRELDLYRGEGGKNLGALKLTMQQFYRPNGDSTQRRGVRSDVQLPSLTTHMDVGEGDLDYALPFNRIDTTKFKVLSLVEPGIVSDLKAKSDERIASSDDFKKLSREITAFKEQKERKTVSLNEKTFFERRKELDAGEKEEEALRDTDKSVKEVVKRDYYMNEVLDVTVDYIKDLAARQAGRLGQVTPKTTP